MPGASTQQRALGDAVSPLAAPDLAMVILVPEADDHALQPGDSADKASAPGSWPGLTDPLYLMTASTPVTVPVGPASISDGPVDVDLPWKNPDDLYELIETIYILYGWRGVEGVSAAVERSLVAHAMALFPLPGLERALPPASARRSAAIHYEAVPTNPRLAVAGLVEAFESSRRTPRVVSALRQVRPGHDLFSQDLPRAHVKGAAGLDAQLAVRVLADALLAVLAARADLTARVRAALARVERETMRLMSAMLTDARAEIVREAGRYFTLTGQESIEAALGLLTSKQTTASGETASHGRIPVGRNPKALQSALHELVPFAQAVLSLEDTPKPGTTVAKMVEDELTRARAALAREIGRRSQVFPVLGQIQAAQVRKAAHAGAEGLGSVLWPILARAHKANQAMRRRTSGFVGMAKVAPAEPFPELALAKVVLDAGLDRSAWGFRKYVEKATERMAGSADQVARRAVQEVNTALGFTDGKAAQALAKAAGEMLALGAATHFAKKLVPVVNVATAAWHISAAIEDYQARHDEFYCALDSRDALVEAAPSAAGLAFDIATEAAFAIF